MAVHRRPPLTVAPPAELLHFHPNQWAGGEWWQSFELWGEARLEFVREHKGTALGTALDVLREHRRYAKRVGVSSVRLAEWRVIVGRWLMGRPLNYGSSAPTTGCR